MIDLKPDRKIKELYAWIAVDPKTHLESIMTCPDDAGLAWPLVSSSREMMEKIKPMVLEALRRADLHAVLLRFDSRFQVDEII